MKKRPAALLLSCLPLFLLAGCAHSGTAEGGLKPYTQIGYSADDMNAATENAGRQCGAYQETAKYLRTVTINGSKTALFTCE